MNIIYKTSIVILLSITMFGCGELPNRKTMHVKDSAPTQRIDISLITDAIPIIEPRSKYGNPESYIINRHRYYVLNESNGYIKRGIASWYGTKFHGKRTSSGEPYDMFSMTAAHKTLPLPTYAEVTNLNNGRSVIIKINDRGPFKDNRVIDLSYAAALKLGITETGTGLVEIRAIDPIVHQQQILAQNSHANNRFSHADLFLQIGAFEERSNAERLRIRLLKMTSANINVMKNENLNDNLYRVRIGPIPSIEEVDRMTSQLSTLGLGQPHIVID